MTAPEQPGERAREGHPLDVGGVADWRHAATRIRRLSLLQLGALMLMGALIILSAVLIKDSITEGERTQGRQEDFHQILTDTRHQMRVQESEFWQYRANGGQGLPRSFVLAAAAGGKRVREIAALAPNRDDPVKRAAGRDVMRSLDALVAVMGEYGPNVPAGSRQERRILSRSATLVRSVSESFARWVARDAELRAASSRRQESLTKKLNVTLLILVGAFVAASLVLWVLVQRGQRRMVGALDDAAQRLAGLAASDPLTGLANHGEFHARLTEEVQRARRHGRDLSLVLMDLDHFKEVNDTRGHQAGDAVLAEAATRLGRLARTADVVGRVGGEEFGWLLPETSVLEAFQAAERARRAVGGSPFPGAERLTLSAGVADLADASSAQDLYQLADSALYWAKSHGRNITFRYSTEVAAALGDGPGSRSARARTLASLRSLARAIDARRPAHRHHSDRVAEVAARVAKEHGWSREEAGELREAAQLLDLGAVSSPEDGDTSAEAARRQILLGVEMARAVLSPKQITWLRDRGERWDGDGVPGGLAGDAISSGGTIIAVAHAWERFTIAGAAEDLVPADTAFDRLRDEAGHAYSPAAVAALGRCLQQGILPLDYLGAAPASESPTGILPPPPPIL